MVELLVVVAVIAVLAALLTPAVLGARAKGHDAACRSNMRQHYSAFMHYASDNDGLLPGFLNPPSVGAPCNGNTWIIWQTTLVKDGYLSGWMSGNRGLVTRGLDCPANINGYYPEPGSTPGNFTFRNGNPDYLYNAGMGVDPSCAGIGLPKVRLSSIANPSQKAVLFEGGQQYGWAQYRSNYALSAEQSSDAIYFNPSSISYTIADPHANASNVLMLDGHVESFARGKIDWQIAALSQP